MSPLSGDAALTASYIQQFHQAQQLRFRTYTQLAQSFDEMLHTKQETPYRDMLAKATVAFQVCSETVNAAESGLRGMQCLDMADMLRVLQLNEKEKLRLTLILQALRQSYSKGFSWQNSNADGQAEEHATAVTGADSCHCCTAAEPTQAEFAAAKTEALQGLQVSIDNINEVLEELKYAEAEYNEQHNA